MEGAHYDPLPIGAQCGLKKIDVEACFKADRHSTLQSYPTNEINLINILIRLGIFVHLLIFQ